MAKLAALLIAALAFQAVFAGDNDHQNPHIVHVKKHIQTVSGNAVSSIQSIQVDQHNGKHAVAAIANELAHEIQVAVYHLHQAVQHNHQGHGNQVLQQVAQSLGDIAHNVQQAVHADHAQVQNVVKSSVQAVVAEVDKLAQVGHQLHQEAEQGQDNADEEVQDVIYELYDAVRQVHARAQIQQKTHQQVKEHIQQVTNDVSNVIQSISSSDQETAHELAHVAHQLAHAVGHAVHHIHNEEHHHEGESRNVLQQVLNKLSEIRASLEHVVASSHGQADVQAKVTELKNQLKTNVHNIAAQEERLIQLVQGNQSGQDHEDLNDLVKDVIAEVVSAVHNAHRQLQVIAEHH